MKKFPRNSKAGYRSKRQPSQPSRLQRAVPILHEDASLVALNKPAGLLAVPIKGLDVPSALSVLSEELERKRERAFVVHRIDRFASGVLLFAKTQHDRQALIRQFLAHTPVREYLVVIRGHLSGREGTLVHHFRRQGMLQKLSHPGDRKAARAELKYWVEQKLRNASLVRVRLGTGLQNQIRVQFSVIGHPVIGDRKYSPEEADERRINRVALHAARLEFIHPRSGKPLSIECEMPADLRALLQGLSQ